MLHAVATATTFASGLQQAFRSDAMTKALHAGHAAAVGVRAGQGARHGVTGVSNILEGEVGFGAALADGGDWSLATRELGTQYNITAITQKNHACCGHTFASIDAVQLLKAQHDIDPGQIESIRVETYRTAIDVTGNFKPATSFEAKFSLPYVIAHALVYGTVRLDAFGPDRREDTAIRNLMARTQLSADPELSAGFPNQRAARVEITLKDGRRVAHFSPHRKGDPEAPLSDAELNDKFDELTGPVLGTKRTHQLRQAIWQLDTLNIRELTALLQPT